MATRNQGSSATVGSVLISGGLDSYACAIMLKEQGLNMRGIFVDYGQAAAAREREAVVALTASLHMPLEQIKIQRGETFGTGEQIGRNAFLLTAGIFLGGARDGALAIGIHAGTPYADCSAQFIETAKALVSVQSNGRLTLVAPFLEWSKLQVFQYLMSKKVPLDQTYSCESGTIPTCGSCASCRDREALGC